MNAITRTMLVTGWSGMLGGVLSGAVLGLFFHKENWMGGYASFRRRLARLGHISFFGLGFLNLLVAFTNQLIPLSDRAASLAAGALIVAAVAMPACCFLAAWRPSFRHLFAVPVVSVFTGIVATLVGVVTN
jgi:predicted lipid-binding transport protein (Tim44 family)